MTQANKQTTTQSGAKATWKLAAKAKPVKTRRITREELAESIEASREKNQPVLDYLAKKPIETKPVSHEKLLAAIEASRKKIQPALDYLKDK